MMDSKATEPGLFAECCCCTGMLLDRAVDVVPSPDVFALASTAGKDFLCCGMREPNRGDAKGEIIFTPRDLGLRTALLCVVNVRLRAVLASVPSIGLRVACAVIWSPISTLLDLCSLFSRSFWGSRNDTCSSRARLTSSRAN